MNLILACDTAKMLNHDFVEPCVTNQFYLRAKHDVYFVGLRAMIEKYFAKPVTQEDVDEAKEVMKARGQYDEAKFARWEHILLEYGGYLPVIIRSVAEGSFISAGKPILTVECIDKHCSWVPYAIDSLILRSIWYPSSLATRLMSLKKELNWCESPSFVYDISGRASECDESAEIAAGVTKMVFPSYDSIQGDMYLWRNYGRKITKPYMPVYLNEHNHVIGWESEKNFYSRLHAIKGNSVAVCLVDTYDVEDCLSLILSYEIQSLARSRNISLFVCPDSVQTTTELKTIYDRIKMTPVGLVKTGIDSVTARSMRKKGFDEGRMLFTLEDSVLKDGLSRNTYGFEYKQCAVKRGAGERWIPVSKHPKNNPEMATLSGLQFPHGSETVYISGHIMEMDGYVPIAKRLA